MKKFLSLLAVVVLACASCSEDEEVYTPYYDWAARNAAWYLSVTDSARTAIREAKAQWGDAWEEHCEWRQLKRLDQSQEYNTGDYTDSICVRIIGRGTGDYAPKWSDSVRISFRGWMMPTVYKLYNPDNVLVDSLMQEVFTQTYYGEFDKATAAPQLSAVSPFVVGFSTAIQYMVQDDDWLVYVPHRLAYGGSVTGSIPAYSTLAWRIHLAAVYPANSGVPSWKVPGKNEGL
ncbi:MAG: peptidylprolyl isomerase [Bacteroidaceae bacterium]|nr:peptidylprolyl isomerase [Bacteroidaceae bacterium]